MDRRRFMKAIGAGLTFPSAFLKALSQNSDLQSGLVEGSIFNRWGDLVELKKSTCSTCPCRKGPDCNIYCARDYCRATSEPEKDILVSYLNGETTLVNAEFTFQPDTWKYVLEYVSEADKATLEEFYEANKARPLVSGRTM